MYMHQQSWQTGNSVTFSKIYISSHLIEMTLWFVQCFQIYMAIVNQNFTRKNKYKKAIKKMHKSLSTHYINKIIKYKIQKFSLFRFHINVLVGSGCSDHGSWTEIIFLSKFDNFVRSFIEIFGLKNGWIRILIFSRSGWAPWNSTFFTVNT